jgi:hypothetical protein
MQLAYRKHEKSRFFKFIFAFKKYTSGLNTLENSLCKTKYNIKEDRRFSQVTGKPIYQPCPS